MINFLPINYHPFINLLENLIKTNKLNNKDLIGFVGAPWTLLVYMINKVSPKNGFSKISFLKINF